MATKIASPRNLKVELERLLTICRLNPSRQILAREMRSLSGRILGDPKTAPGFVIGPAGLEEPASKITLQPNTLYYLGASSSPTTVILTSVSDDKVTYMDVYGGNKGVMERWIAADLLTKGTKTALKTYGRYMDSETKRSLTSLLKGGRGKTEKLDDWKRVKWLVAPAPGLEGEDLWRAAEEYGNVGGLEKDGVNHYEIEGFKKDVEKVLNDRRFKVVKK